MPLNHCDAWLLLHQFPVSARVVPNGYATIHLVSVVQKMERSNGRSDNISRKRKQGMNDGPDDEENALNELLFGNSDVGMSAKGSVQDGEFSDGEDENSLSVDNTRQPAWTDSDDDSLTISLTNTNRLKKLRTDESERSVTGSEYVRRLRMQARFHLSCLPSMFILSLR